MDNQYSQPDTAPAESTPLLQSPENSENRPKNSRAVTFSANPVTRIFDPEAEHHSLSHRPVSQGTGASASVSASSAPGPPMLAALNSKLRRRNSHGAVPSTSLPFAGPKIGPQRSTKKTEKLKLLPNPELEDEGEDEESGRDVYSQYTRIKDPTARRDAARLGKADRDRLPRVTAYCTANRYNMEAMMRFLKGRGKTRGAHPKLIDECIYTPYSYSKQTRQQHESAPSFGRQHSTGNDSTDSFPQQGHRESETGFENGSTGSNIHHEADAHGESIPHEDLLGASIGDEGHIRDNVPDFDIQIHTPEVFLFDYGVVVIWGMTETQETKFLKDISKFELEKLAPDDVEIERFNFYYTREYQARIYNDFITLRDKNNYMTKLAISHALAQSVKTSLFEELIASTVETCKDIPTQIALTGKIALSRSQINMQIGELFILRINIHLNGSVLDTPELFWVEPQLEPVYQAVRSYLEMDQRVGLLTERLDVIADLLAVLKDQLSHGHGEKLEWIVIVLIAMEILVAIVNIVVDLYAG
jgi:uncharacterized Rmd1/YagE family protein